MKPVYLLSIAIAIVLSGCASSPQAAPTSTRQPVSTATSTAPASPTVIPPTETEIPTSTATRTPKPTVQYPIHQGADFPVQLEQIQAMNVSQLELLADYRDESTCYITKSEPKAKFCSEGVFVEERGVESRIGAEDLRPYIPFRLASQDDLSQRSAASKDARVLAMVNDQARLVAFDRSGTILADLDLLRGEPQNIFIALSPDGRYLAYETEFVDQFLKLYDLQQGAFVNIPQYNAQKIRFSSDSQFLYFYQFEKSWVEPKLKVLASPEWKLAERSDAMTEYDQIVSEFSMPQEYYWQPKMEAADHVGGFFKVNEENGQLWVSLSQISASSGSVDGTFDFGVHRFCKYPVGNDPICQTFDEYLGDRIEKFVSGRLVYTAVNSVAKFTSGGNLKKGVTTIYGGDLAEGNIVAELPDFARIYQFSPANHLAFYQPLLIGELGGLVGTERQAAYYNFASDTMQLSFETAGRESVAGYVSDANPYAITILNNSIGKNDQFNVFATDGSIESEAGWLNNTTQNARPVFSMAPDQTFFVVVSTKPLTKKDGVIYDHLVVNQFYMNNLDDQRFFEIAPLPRPDIVEYNIDRHGQEIEPAAMDVEISPDGKMAVIGLSSGKVIFLDLESGDVMHEILAHTAGIQSLTFSPAGDLLFTLDQTGSIRVFGIQ